MFIISSLCIISFKLTPSLFHSFDWFYGQISPISFVISLTNSSSKCLITTLINSDRLLLILYIKSYYYSNFSFSLILNLSASFLFLSFCLYLASRVLFLIESFIIFVFWAIIYFLWSMFDLVRSNCLPMFFVYWILKSFLFSGIFAKYFIFYFTYDISDLTSLSFFLELSDFDGSGKILEMGFS